MDPYTVLADRYATSTLPDLGHSALPNAPQQPYVERRRWVQTVFAAARRRPAPGIDRRRGSTAPACPTGTLRGVNSGG